MLKCLLLHLAALNYIVRQNALTHLYKKHILNSESGYRPLTCRQNLLFISAQVYLFFLRLFLSCWDPRSKAFPLQGLVILWQLKFHLVDVFGALPLL